MIGALLAEALHRPRPVRTMCSPSDTLQERESHVFMVEIDSNVIAVHSQSKYGDIQLSMSYLQSAERLTISVLKAKGLPIPSSVKSGENPGKFREFYAVAESAEVTIGRRI